MSPVTYALLVGIDEYPPVVSPLRGCVNDIRHLETMLQARLQTEPGHAARFKPLVLLNKQATRQAVIDGFRTHLSQAGKEDVVLFYYSGHGSQAHSPQEFWHLEPDHLDETLVCWDSRLDGHWDLADKELAQLIAEVADKGAHVAVILDCCHSGSGTRNANDADVRARRLPTDARIRPLNTFLVDAQQVAALNTGSRSTGGDGGWYSLPRGRHVVFSACSPEETAKELYLGGEQRGAFSYHLLDTLQRAKNDLSYRDLFKRVNALVRANISLQSPQMEATQTEDLEQPFLGGAIPAGPRYFTVSRDKTRGWMLDSGAVHGLPAPVNGETTLLSLFPFDSDIATLHDLSKAVGDARITQVLPGQSTVDITMRDGHTLDQTMTYKAIVTALPLPPLVVALEGDEAGLALIRTALAQGSGPGSPSLLVREGDRTEAELIVRAEENAYRIRRKGDGYALVVETKDYTPSSAGLVVQRLEHIARWYKIVALDNPDSQIKKETIQVEVELPDGQGDWQPAPVGSSTRLEYAFRDGEWKKPTFRVKLTNTSGLRLYYMAFNLTEIYGVFSVLPGSGIWLEPGQETWAGAGEPFEAWVPDELWEAGTTQFTDTLLLIASTNESDATLLAQDDLPFTAAPKFRSTPKNVMPLSTLERLMYRVNTRSFGPKSNNSEAYSDWNTFTLSFTVIRPQAAEPLAAANSEATLADGGIRVKGHPTLQGRARLTNLPEVSRDVGNRTLPAILRDHPQVAQPFEFSATRGGEPGLSVLELIDVKNYTDVTPENPLVIEIQSTLAKHESLLPLAQDGEFFLPLGRVKRRKDGVTVTLERLPPPSGERSIGGSIKILFQKLVGQRLGLNYTYPQLAVATVSKAGNVRYTKDVEKVRQAIAGCSADEPIVLYIHGIVGNTKDIVAGIKTRLDDRYKLLLTFDYENLHTPIEENARLLKARLAEVGLGPNHGKTVHIVAHSMGGLISRWFIEREAGNQVVQHLVMLGTPNAGSPWPTVQEWATVALGVGLNSLASVAWPIQAVSTLTALLEKVDVALDQMMPGSELLATLADSPDPGIPYTILAGNTSIIPAALAASADGQTIFGRLWERIKPANWLHSVTAPVFFGQPNDIAVSVKSIQGIPASHTKQLPPVEVACDHITYFDSEAGLSALSQALSKESSG